jgi:hypothetical protein
VCVRVLYPYDWATEKSFRHTPIHCGRSGGRPTEHTPIPLTANYHKWYELRMRKAGEHTPTRSS